MMTDVDINGSDDPSISNVPESDKNVGAGASNSEDSPTNVEELLSDLNGLLLDEDPAKKLQNNSNGDLSNGVVTVVLATNGVTGVGDGSSGMEEPNIEKMSKLYDKYSQQCSEIEK